MAGTAEFAQALERLRLAKGVSPAQMARDMDEYEGNISRWRKGKGIDLVNVRKLANYFGVDETWLENLAGYGDSEHSLAQESLEAERQIWRARYDSLMEKTVPRWAWNVYMEACDALAETFRNITPGELSTPDQRRLSSSTAESGESHPGADKRNLADTYRPSRSTQRITSRALASVAG